jgi:site-specific DNA-methyltransferase (adenine-specific)
MKRLYFGDNLQVLRESINSESVDLVYLDLSLGDRTSQNLAINKMY